jgi:hypothetical protein
VQHPMMKICKLLATKYGLLLLCQHFWHARKSGNRNSSYSENSDKQAIHLRCAH